MKKIFAILFTVGAPLLMLAQEVAEKSAEAQDKGFTVTTKWTMVGIWTVIIIVLVLRTFRGKSDI